MGGVAGVAGVVGRDEGPFAVALDQGPAVQALAVVMVGTQAVEQVEHGQAGGGPVHPWSFSNQVVAEQPSTAQVG